MFSLVILLNPIPIAKGGDIDSDHSEDKNIGRYPESMAINRQLERRTEMLSRKGLILTLTAIFFATLMVTGTAVQGTAGGGPAAVPYTWKAVGPELSGEVTLVPTPDNRFFKATLKGDCGNEKVTITADIPIGKDLDQLTAVDITNSATNHYLKKEIITLKDPKKVFKPASGNGDMVILNATGIQVTGKGAKMQATGQAKVTYITEQKP
jgi:hypothetical protein